ncbi:MAG: DUF5667 domain-containing protein [Patescibacteria group bacterium]
MSQEFEKHIKKATDSVRLSHPEKIRMCNVLESYMRFNPLPEPVTSYTITRDWVIYLHRPLAAALVLVLVSTTGISYAAESALPGDVLYAVKTKVNEPVKVALASSAEAKAEVQMTLAERRIEEATTLAAEGRLDEAVQESLAVAFVSHAEAVAEEIEKVEAEDVEDIAAPVALSTRFETRLAAREEILHEVRSVSEEHPNGRFAQALGETSRAVASIREHAEERLAFNAPLPADFAASIAPSAARSLKAEQAEHAVKNTDAPAITMAATPVEAPAPAATTSPETPADAPDTKAVERMRGAAEKSLKAAQKALRSARSLTKDARAKAETDIEFAEELLNDGKELLEDGAHGDAFIALQESLKTSESVHVYIKAAPTLEKARSRSQRNDTSSRDDSKKDEQKNENKNGDDRDRD